MSWLLEWDAFVKTVDSGSMAAAARQMGSSRAHISKMLAELERAVGTRLLERTTRRQNMTPSGEIFYQQALRVLAEITATELALQSVISEPQGVVRISAPVSFGRLHIAPLLSAIANPYPKLSCELVLNDRRVNVLEENFDIAVRLTDTPPEDLVAHRLTTIERFICASPTYLQRMGIPQCAKDLNKHCCFAYSHATTQSQWSLAGPRGTEVIAVRGKFQVNHVETVLSAALQGDGIAILPDYLCSQELARGDLCHILHEYEPITSFGRNVYVCYARNRIQLAKFRLVLSALEAHFTPHAPWRSG